MFPNSSVWLSISTLCLRLMDISSPQECKQFIGMFSQLTELEIDGVYIEAAAPGDSELSSTRSQMPVLLQTVAYRGILCLGFNQWLRCFESTPCVQAIDITWCEGFEDCFGINELLMSAGSNLVTLTISVEIPYPTYTCKIIYQNYYDLQSIDKLKTPIGLLCLAWRLWVTFISRTLGQRMTWRLLWFPFWRRSKNCKFHALKWAISILGSQTRRDLWNSYTRISNCTIKFAGAFQVALIPL